MKLPALVTRANRTIGVLVALLLLSISVALAWHNEDIAHAEKVRAVQVQASILAGSLAGPLAFDDSVAEHEYIDALKANPDFEIVGAYDRQGRLVASFTRAGEQVPAINRIGPPRLSDHQIVVAIPVVQGGTQLGSIYIRAATERWSRRAARYLGIAIVVVMACLLIAVLGSSYASVSAANRRLQAEIAVRQKAEAALRQAQKMEAMGQLTGGVAHDFNNLLMVASSGLELLERTTDPIKRDRLKDGIRQAIERGAKLTQQLLTFARRSPLTPEIFDVGIRIRGLDDLLERSLREDITINLNFGGDLWPIEVDPSQFDVAVLNIAINARDAMPDGGAIRITAENIAAAAERPDLVQLTISDTGTGIPPDMLQKVFEPFFTTKGVGTGTGLGLSQVYGFMRASGGEITIESEVGTGTTVSLHFPRSLKALPISPEVSRHAHLGGNDARVLLVEDDDHVAALVGEMLTELRYSSQRVASALEGLTLLASGAIFDLVLSDMIMPGKMNGLELAQEIARLQQSLPVVLMTGYSEAAASAATEGFPLLVKPYTIEALGDALGSALKGQ